MPHSYGSVEERSRSLEQANKKTYDKTCSKVGVLQSCFELFTAYIIKISEPMMFSFPDSRIIASGRYSHFKAALPFKNFVHILLLIVE